MSIVILLGLLYGAAVGDALGIATENMKPDECQFYYDADTINYCDIIRDEHRTKWKPGDWTTDFDQVVCIFAGIFWQLLSTYSNCTLSL